jgi:hypothetical protein
MLIGDIHDLIFYICPFYPKILAVLKSTPS